MNWYHWSLGENGWTVPFWFIPLAMFWLFTNKSDSSNNDKKNDVKKDVKPPVGNRVSKSSIPDNDKAEPVDKSSDDEKPKRKF